jgi:hypothetical protein
MNKGKNDSCWLQRRNWLGGVVIGTAALVVGGAAACLAQGEISAWGENGNGQCTVPAPNSCFIAVATGEVHGLGLRADGSIAAWGDNSYGQCTIPTPNSNFVAVGAGSFHSLGVKADGSVIAWGWNAYGQCTIPTPNTAFVAVEGGYLHSIGLKTDGSIVAWGGNFSGECNVPAPNTGFVAVAGGASFSIGLKSTGSIVAWGTNGSGECNVPAPNAGFVALAAGFQHSLGLKADGSIVAWGLNMFGQCDVPTPNADFVAVAGFHHSLGVKADGSLVAWGYNDSGQCEVPSPNTGFVAVQAGYAHSFGLKGPGPAILSILDVPRDQGLRVRATWQRSVYDLPNSLHPITGYSVWRRIDSGAKSAGGRENAIARMTYPPGDWDYITTVPARGEPEYNAVVPTLCDSTEAGISLSTFFVSAMTASPWVYYDSEPASGYSVDNIVPPAPTGFVVASGAQNALNWDESPAPDFAWFAIHRGTVPDFVPAPGNLIHLTTSLSWTDIDGTWGHYYKLIAVDDAGNRSAPAGPAAITGAGEAPGAAIAQLRLYPNHPNPFNPRTTIRFDLPVAGQAQLSIYDLAGRLVRVLVEGEILAGSHQAVWDGRDASGRSSPSGSYLARLVAGGKVEGVRLSLVR